MKLMTHECDVLVPSTVERVITSENASRLKCKVIAEASHGPVTAFAERILEEKGIQIIPDILLNAGGVTVSYFEWLKNIQHVDAGRLTRRWEERSTKLLYTRITGIELTDDRFNVLKMEHKLHGTREIDIVTTCLEDMVCSTLDKEFAKSLELNTNIRTAAMATAIDKIANNYKESGLLF